MFKQVAAGLLMLCFMAQAFSSAAIVGSYYVNTADYAKNCINKAKPKLHCNGKCQMMKKLKQEEKKDAQNPERRNSGRDEVLSSKSHFASLYFLYTSFSIDYSHYLPFATVDIAKDIFHPPGI